VNYYNIRLLRKNKVNLHGIWIFIRLFIKCEAYFLYIFFFATFPLSVIENYFPRTFPLLVPSPSLFPLTPSSPRPKFQKYHHRPDIKPIKHIIILYSSFPIIIIIIIMIILYWWCRAQSWSRNLYQRTFFYFLQSILLFIIILFFKITPFPNDSTFDFHDDYLAEFLIATSLLTAAAGDENDAFCIIYVNT